MEALSIVSASVSVAKLCRQIYTIIDSVKNVDTSIRVLGIEINSLSGVLETINATFSEESLASSVVELHMGHEGQYWQTVKQSINDCRATLTSLERILEGVRLEEGQILRQPRTRMKLTWRSTEITLHKQQIAAYRQTLQLALQMITL